MPSASSLLGFAVLCFVMIVIPGPSVLFTIGRALAAGRRDALLTVVGNAAGVSLHIVAVALGVGAVVQRSVEALTVMKLIGAAYVIYLGVQAIRHRRALNAAVPGPALTVRRRRRALRDGFVVGVTNPKSIVFFVAVLPQFVEPAQGNVALQLLVLGAVGPLIALLTDSAWALLASAVRDWFARSPQRLARIGGVGGAAMIGVGAHLAITGHRS